jgi:hypothetical protein
VQDLLNRLNDMHVVSRRATQAASHTQFNIDDAHGTRITLKAGGTVLLDLVVGDAVGAGTSVRRPGANEVFEADQSLSSMLSQQPRDWRNREITRVERGQVTRVEWVNPNGTFTFTRSGETWTPATPIERLDTARVGAVVLVADCDEEATELLGADYPFRLPGTADDAMVAARLHAMRDGFGGADWALARSRMGRLREVSSAGYLRALIRANFFEEGGVSALLR